jgi:hypothetical protein
VCALLSNGRFGQCVGAGDKAQGKAGRIAASLLRIDAVSRSCIGCQENH